MLESQLEFEAQQALHRCERLLSDRKYGEAHQLLHDFRETHLESSDGSEVSQQLRDEHALQHARALYRDPEMPKDLALSEALELLHADLQLETTLDPDVLYLAGRIHEERWDRDGQWLQLRQALNYYGHGHVCAAEGTVERALNGTRAAFILQVLARQDESAAYATSANPDFTRSVPTGSDIEGRPPYLPESSREFRDQSKAIKEDLLRELKPALEAGQAVSWHFYAAAAECLFGLRRYEEAGKVLQAIAPDRPPNRQDSIAKSDLEAKDDAGEATTTGHDVTTGDQPDDLDLQELARRLVYLARIQGDRPEFDQARDSRGWAAKQALTEFLHVDEDMINSTFVGKVGLALSGGGFRAALFHIGVLARLADLRILPHLEVLSCVSGGSIVGTYYYLELKELMESRPDEAITDEDYEKLVERVCERFLQGVQRNIRGRLFNNVRVNAKMLGRYSPSQRLGDLLESEIFSLVEHNGAQSTERSGNESAEHDGAASTAKRRRLFLRDLWIKPPGERDQFTPKHDNWRRRNKVPILVLNATSLNTGHNWQFTGSHMGEPTGIIRPDIDASPRLGRITFEKGDGLARVLEMIRSMGRREFREFMHRARKLLDANQRPIRLGDAVAASAAVPGIFEPLALDGYYSDQQIDWSVRLADGGLHDNQGVAGLVEQGCNVLFVSDASGQMSSIESPPGGLLPALRSNLILMQRVRTAQFDELETRRRTGLVRDFMFIHLNQDLQGAVVAPKGENEQDSNGGPTADTQRTVYGVAKEAQRRLALLRTDLDSFSEVEAYSLMTSGYLMTCNALATGIGPFPLPSVDTRLKTWDFLKIRPLLEEPSRNDRPTVEAHNEVMRQLDAGSHRAFKWFRAGQGPGHDLDHSNEEPRRRRSRLAGFKWISVPLAVTALVVGLVMLVRGLTRILPSDVFGIPILVFVIALPVLAVLAVVVFGQLVGVKVKPSTVVWHAFLFLVPGLLAWPIWNLHLWTTDRLFKRRGRLDRVMPSSAK